MGAKKGTEQSKLERSMPTTPDPFWPEGVAPGHLTAEQQGNSEIVAPYIALRGEQWHCAKCGTTMRRSKDEPSMCATCYAKEKQNTALARQTNSNWMEEAKELGLQLFERQPGETDQEWRIWEKYRSYYPLKLPTYTELANAVGCAVGTVIKAVQRWSYKVRLIEWARYTDAGIQEERIRAIREMNEKQLNMARGIQDKLAKAIEHIEPTALRPGEIVNLFKVSTELERRIRTYVEETVEQEVLADKQSKQHDMTKAEDLSEVLEILQKTGVLQNVAVGIEQTKTRLLVKGNGENGEMQN